MELVVVKDLSIVVAGVVALLGMVTGVVEYIRRGRQERAHYFLDLRRRFLEDESFRHILNLLGTDDPSLESVSVQERRNVVGFFEEVALMVESRLCKRDVAHYMYGHYINLISVSENFWKGLDPQSNYWAVYRQFAAELRMRPTEKPFRRAPAF